MGIWLPFFLGFFFSINSPASDSRSITNPEDEIYLVTGEIETIKTQSLTRASLSDPKVADIVSADDKEVLLIGKGLGQTALFLWDETGKRTIMVYVFNQNLELIKERISKLLRAANINDVNLDIDEKEGKVVLSGEIPDNKKQSFKLIDETFSKDVINLVVEEQGEDLIQVDMQIAELNTTLTKSLGIDWHSKAASGATLNYDETLPTADGSPSDFFKIGDFRRVTSIQATVNALLEEGKARILSNPKLVVVSGEEAKFLVGGQIPIRTTTQTTTGSQQNVSFRDYGISMVVKPKVKDGKIDLTLSMEVSDVDASVKVGEDVGFTTRTANTRLYLDDNQTIILAGLIKHNESKNVKRVPLLGSIPVLGALFRSRADATPATDQELVISITPTILVKKEKWANKIKTSNGLSTEDSTGAGIPRKDMPTINEYSTKILPYYSGVSKEMTEYVRTIQQKISQSTVYPDEALEYGWEGTVKLGLLILNDGTLALASIKESSGYEIFDQYALDIAKKMAPYDVFPPDANLQELNVIIPIVYSLKRN